MIAEGFVARGMGLRLVDKIAPYDFNYWNGRLVVWEMPENGAEYAIGVDPAMGVNKDRSVIEVIRKGDLKRPDEQVAEYACDFLDPVAFADVVNTVGRFYRDNMGTEAFATIEVNAECGDQIVQELRMRLDYGNLFIWKFYDKLNNVLSNRLGWWTTPASRPKIITRGIRALQYEDLIVHSPWLIDEFADFEQDHFAAKAKAKWGKHDDRVMALFIGFWGAHDEEWMMGEDIAEERRLLTDASKLMQAKSEQSVVEGEPKRVLDYFSMPVSFEKAMRDAEERLLDD